MRSSWDFLAHPLALALAVLLAVATAYQRVPSAPFQYDDHLVLESLPFLDGAALLDVWRNFPAGRPVTQASFALDGWRAGGADPRAFHITNLVLHLIACGLVWRLALAVGCSVPGAALGALLFAIHPLQAQSAACVVNRAGILAAIGGLAAVLSAIRRRWVAAAAWWLLALGGKESAAAVPVLAMLFTGPDARARRGLAIAAGLCALAAVPALRGHLALHPGGAAEILAQVRVLPECARLALMPLGQSVLHRTPLPVWGGWAWAVILGSLFALRHRPGAVRATAWALLCLLPGTVIPLEDALAEHRLYLALALPAAVAGEIMARQPRGPGAAALVLLGLLTMGRGAAWAEPRLLWAEACRVSPGSGEAWHNLGAADLDLGRPEAALTWGARALLVRPGDRDAQSNAGLAFKRLGNAAAAEAAWRGLPGHIDALRELGRLCMEQGRLEEAERLLGEAVLLSGRHDLKALNDLGTVLAGRGAAAQALQIFTEVLSRDPARLPARINLGLVLLELGDPEAARAALEEARRKVPDDPAANLALGRIYEAEAMASYASLPQPEEALNPPALRSVLEAAAGQRPGDPYVAEALRRLALAEAGWRQAESCFQAVLISPPGPENFQAGPSQDASSAAAQALEHLGALATVQGRLEEGCRFLRRALELNPGNAKAREFLERHPPPPETPWRPVLPGDLARAPAASGPAPAPAAP